MTPRPTTRQIPLTLLTVDGDCAVPGTFRHEPTDPYAVRVGLHLDECLVEWFMGRELLQAGLEDVAGIGDVCVHPGVDEHGRAVVHLELSSPDGAAVLMMPARELEQFLADSYRSVPAGAEIDFLDIDAALVDLLADR
jgi:hypothetical protein